MVRRSTLVYDLLKSEEQPDGFSPKQILERVSQAHNIAPGRGLKKQITVALRRGIDFGILTKQRNKYRFDLDFLTASEENVERGRKKRMKRKKSKSSKTRKARTKSKSRRKRVSTRKSSQEPPPRPRVVPPPNWTPKKRNLREEPIPKFIRHSDHPPIPL